MKKQNYSVVFCILIHTILFLSCKVDTTTIDPVDTSSIGLLSYENIIGKWTKTTTEIDPGYITQKTINWTFTNNFTFIQFSKSVTTPETGVETTDYRAIKGTFSVSDNNKLTIHQTHEASSNMPIDEINAEWVVSDFIKISMVPLINNKLYEYAFKRVGTGVDLIGSWSNENFNSKYIPPYRKYQYVFTTTSYTSSIFDSINEEYSSIPISTQSVNIVINANNSFSYFQNSVEKIIFYNIYGDWLVIGDSISADCYTFTKE